MAYMETRDLPRADFAVAPRTSCNFAFTLSPIFPLTTRVNIQVASVPFDEIETVLARVKNIYSHYIRTL